MMDEQEILNYLYKIVMNPQMQISAPEASKIVACQDWLVSAGAKDGTEEKQSSA